MQLQDLSSLTRDQATPVSAEPDYWTAKEFPLFFFFNKLPELLVEWGQVTKQRGWVGRVVEWKEHRP